MSILLEAIGGTVVLAVFAVIFGLFLAGIDRIAVARLQARVGPRLRQPYTDVIKLFGKQNVVPKNAVSFLFNLMPVIALASAIILLLYLPFGSFAPILGAAGDMILVLYLFIVPSLCLVIGGFASGSPYATVGAQREMVSMIAYELPLAAVVVLIAWRLMVSGVSEPFSLLSMMQTSIWDVCGPLGIVGIIILLFLFAWITPGELSKVPFDSPEAETELAGGILAEYSGRNLGMFSIAQSVKTVAILAFGVALLLPWNLSPLFGLAGALAILADLAFFVVKVLVVMLISVTLIRTMMARFRITQVVKLYWFIMGGLALVALILFLLDAFLMGVI
ncbi:MAG TPA: NADH-quinone oxidoreductase subunit H [Methanocorpusculum sp.]|nr:NADH-quinone oxidoreductase subunit H [Methanocorpusculum sp.]HJJ40211.1 NADH-quinone oxidoreductase subunit H [Methanocorpusculum sp.]HJJ49600.1 NADH-quinone oxidoreductase subunit H [Methanocorpusculum sp.]HJJ57685.1 NADH-quinone oxidoreductase subunit H [Methanocorpusculum sp.]